MRPRRSIVRSGLGDQVYETLSERILDLEYAPGERLVIDQIARELGVSGTPVRDALNRLAAEELVDFTQFRGFSVLPYPTADEIRCSFEAREAIETFAIRVGCERATDRQLTTVCEIQERLASRTYGRRSWSFSAFVRLNRSFHEELVATSGNPVLVGALHNLYHDALVARMRHGRGVPDLDLITAEHDAILEALVRRDAAAAEAAVRRHIRDGAQRTLALVQEAW